MTSIKAVVRDGRIETREPIDLPDGTELTIPLPDCGMPLGLRDDEWPNTPEAIEAWIRWYDSLEPLEFAPSERAAWEAARQEDRQFELAQWENRSRSLEAHFP
jgi:hypothetical protein